MKVSIEDFLRAIWGEVEGVAELSEMPPGGGILSLAYLYPQELGTLVSDASKEVGKKNLFFGVCLRSKKWPKGKRGTSDLALSCGALWVDIDFSKTPREEALKRLREFPIRASVGVLSGGGIHAYWLLREPVVGDELRRVPPTNRALATALGGDHAHDLARILRLPGTLNLKYTPPRPCEVVVWRPELRYTLLDFEGILQVDTEGDQNKTSYHADSERFTEFRDLPDQAKVKVSEILRKIWTPGLRHAISLHVAGALAHAGISPACTKEIISSAASGDEEIGSRLTDVDTTYSQYERGENVAGIPELLKVIDTQLPEISREPARKALQAISTIIRPPKKPGRPKKREVEPDFEVVKIVKFDSRPARYEVTVRKDGAEYQVTCETETLISIRSFRVAFFEATRNLVIAPISQMRWETMLSEAPTEIRPAPPEATTAGAVAEVLREFVLEAKEDPDAGEIRSYAGRNEDGVVFFRLEALKAALRESGVKATDREVIHLLRDQGWETTTRRVGSKVVRVWQRNGKHQASEDPKEGG